MNIGTIAENISCFEPDPDDDDIISAAKIAGVYGLIGALPDGFETDLKTNPHLLSSGQTQRLALARAIYMKPQYLFLDEPNALLDADGERALGQTLLRLKSQGTTIVMILHRSGIMGLADKVMQLKNGRMADFGKRAEMLERLGIGGRQIELPILKSSHQDLEDWIGSYFTRATDQEFCQNAKRISTDLFAIATLHCPEDTLRFARFFFKFISETRCEIIMVEPFESDAVQTLKALRQQVGSDSVAGRHCPQEHALLDRILAQSDGFEISAENESTRYIVRLILSQPLAQHPAQPEYQSQTRQQPPRSKAG